MNFATVFGLALNLSSREDKGYDAFECGADQNRFVMCDGANSCPNSKAAARWMATHLASWESATGLSVSDFESAVFQAHETLLKDFPDSGTTLVSAEVNSSGLVLCSLGDSFLQVYQRRFNGWGRWRKRFEMPRDVDANGHPSQMLGSEVCGSLHSFTLPAEGTYCALLMTDGAGLFLTSTQIVDRLQVIGREMPGPDDLSYLSRCLAETALQAGSRDDVSVAMVWIRFGD